MPHFSTLNDLHTNNAWVTIGAFDGVHLGHQKIVQNMVAGAHMVGAPAIAITFHPHPAVFLRRITEAYYLSSPDERAFLLDQLGVDHIVTLPFDQALADRSAREFMSDLMTHTHLKQLWVGYDFALGRNRMGNVDYLRSLGEKLDYQVISQPPVKKDGEIISSSQIRQWVANGEMEQAAEWLGRWYSVEGEVVHGDGRGRHIGIPTANLAIWPEKRLPAPGVYAAFAWVGGHRFQSVLNLGYRPTFESEASAARLEVHILDFASDLYGQKVRLEITHRLRDEKRFDNVDSLLVQIHDDIKNAREVLDHVP